MPISRPRRDECQRWYSFFIPLQQIGRERPQGHPPGESCRASERGIRILCDYLVVIGFLNKGENRYGLTPDSAKFLDRRSPACMATIARFIISPTLTGAFRDVAAAVRT